MQLLPPIASLCAVCRGWGRTRLCDTCRSTHANARPRCPHCAVPVPAAGLACIDCRRAPPPHVSAVAAVDYGFPWDGRVTALKYHGATDLAAPLAALLVAAVRGANLEAPACVLPVPSGPQRLAERGYNQAWEIARRVARTLALPAHAGGLQRWADGVTQVGQSRAERIDALRGAFGVGEPKLAARWQGRSVALVDDVMTSGATAAEASRVLLAAGAAAVQIWVVARKA